MPTIIDEQILKNIAQEIREGTNSNEKIVPSDFPQHIKQIVQQAKNLEDEKQQLLLEQKQLKEEIVELTTKPPIPTSTITLHVSLNVYLHGYSATTYSNGKFYCNYIIPQKRECYNTLTIENVVRGSTLTLTISAKDMPIKFEGIECLEASKDFYTYLFKVKDDTDIYISN